jgi:L-threonylcarbamoyladenylate synthase
MTADERALRGGGLAILPTDTVYGIGCAAGLVDACARLYACKSRPPEQPTALVAGSLAGLLERALPELTGRAAERCRAVFPGPVTLIVPNPGHRFAHLCGAAPDRIGVRVPVLPADVAGLADAVGGLALTSANLRGEPPPGRLSDVPGALRRLCVVEIDGGELAGTASSVIDVTGADPVLIRAGADAESALARLR